MVNIYNKNQNLKLDFMNVIFWYFYESQLNTA